jgi:cytochrome c oxidase subunit 1
MFGRMYSNKLANIAWGILFTGFNLLYFPLFVIGIQGMPRRYFDYLPQFQTGHVLSTIGAFILFAGLILMVFNLFYHIKHGAIASANPWKGVTLEWQIPSPPSHENFEEIPLITTKPYLFGNSTDNK